MLQKWPTPESRRLWLWVYYSRERERDEGKERLGSSNGSKKDGLKALNGFTVISGVLFLLQSKTSCWRETTVTSQSSINLHNQIM